MNFQLPKTFQKILVIRRDNIGDLLCTTPLLSVLRRHYPDAKIAVLVNSYNAPVLVNNPDINQIFCYTKAKHSSRIKLHSWWKQWRLLHHIRRQKFDLIIHANPVPHHRVGRLVEYLAAPYQLGVDDGHGHFNIPVTIKANPNTHHVEQVLALLEPLGIGSTLGSQEPPEPLKLIVPNCGQENRFNLTVGIHLSSRKPCNRWPYASYVQLIEDVLNKTRTSVKIFWAPGPPQHRQHPGDDDMAALLVEKFKTSIEAAATKTLSELINQINQVDIMVCPDGGAIHIAAALQKPTVGLYGCTDARIWGPWRTKSIVLTGDGDAASITEADVFDALKACAGME